MRIGGYHDLALVTARATSAFFFRGAFGVFAKAEILVVIIDSSLLG